MMICPSFSYIFIPNHLLDDRHNHFRIISSSFPLLDVYTTCFCPVFPFFLPLALAAPDERRQSRNPRPSATFQRPMFIHNPHEPLTRCKNVVLFPRLPVLLFQDSGSASPLTRDPGMGSRFFPGITSSRGSAPHSQRVSPSTGRRAAKKRGRN